MVERKICEGGVGGYGDSFGEVAVLRKNNRTGGTMNVIRNSHQYGRDFSIDDGEGVATLYMMS